MPTEDGTPLHAGRTPDRDATVVTMLRQAGAVILGKTVTTECAYYHPGKTRNPHNPEHTPGGSSSGSAAAVAAGMVPLALGSQTNGSTIRPAAYCGVYGFKPTHGLVPRGGVLQLSRTLDHVGLFARTLEDIALVAEQVAGYDPLDPDTRPRARPPFLVTVAEEPPLPVPTLTLDAREPLDPDEALARARRAQTLGRIDDAVRLASVAASARPDDVTTLCALAELLIGIRRPRLAGPLRLPDLRAVESLFERIEPCILRRLRFLSGLVIHHVPSPSAERQRFMKRAQKARNMAANEPAKARPLYEGA